MSLTWAERDEIRARALAADSDLRDDVLLLLNELDKFAPVSQHVPHVEPTMPEDRLIIELSRSHVLALADKIEPLLKTHKNKKAVAGHLHVSWNHIHAILKRGASVRMARVTLAKLARGLDVDVSSWDVSPTGES